MARMVDVRAISKSLQNDFVAVDRSRGIVRYSLSLVSGPLPGNWKDVIQLLKPVGQLSAQLWSPWPQHQQNKSRIKYNRYFLAEPGVSKARSHSKWPSRGLSSGTPGLNRLACSGIRGEGGAQHAIEHTKPHPAASADCSI